jgi:DNA-binding MarR family transcriptional regulator
MGNDSGLDVATGLIRLAHLIQHIQIRVAERHSITPAQGRLICALAERPRRMADLAHDLGVEKAAMTGLVDRVERQDLVERRPAPDDRRALHVTLTDAGRNAATAFHADATAELEQLVSTPPADEAEQLRTAIDRILTSAQRSRRERS